jgi:hypothetical protein
VGEMTVKTLNSFNPLTYTKPSNVKIVQDHLGLSQTDILIPHTKSAPHGETISWAKQSGPADPEAALQVHLLYNAPPINGHLFAYRWKGTYCPLTKSAFLKHIQQAAKDAQLELLQGHGIQTSVKLHIAFFCLFFSLFPKRDLNEPKEPKRHF